ncbi:hypothetical protein Glove_613g2 [Diversispora epigaea]|uniref:Uncharacterized protein n=1 Tax=Diversispora epigaea TaxID=1348612 RepID=A0A397GEQ8_9GLOM|nr:hypothetical protein Glove_613g2 [Diversispora epigaea]
MSDLNQLFKRKNQPSLRSNSRPSSSFSSSSSSSRPTLESENSDLTGLTGSTGLTSRNNDATMKRIFSKLDNLQKMLEKIMKNQEKMQDDIKLVKEEVAILSYDQDCVYSVILESAQNLLEKIIYPTFDQFKETAKSFMEKSDINFFSSLGHRWEPFYHKKIRVNVNNLQKMLEKIMKNQEKMQDDIKLVKEEVAILSYDQDCVYSVILESAQNLLEKIIYPTFDQFKETAKSFMEKSDINFFSSLGHRWEPFYHKKIRVNVSKIYKSAF